MQELLSEVAYAKIEAAKEKTVLPEFCNQETFTMLVEDNIDHLEETLSGECLILNLTYFSQVCIVTSGFLRISGGIDMLLEAEMG